MNNFNFKSAISDPEKPSQCVCLDVGDRVRHRNKPDAEGTVIELDFRLPQPQVWVQWDNLTGREVNPPKPYSTWDLVKVDVQNDDVDAVVPKVVPPIMSVEEARDCLDQIGSHLRSIRALLLELDERQGWKALGYKSMRQCLLTEFKQKKSHLRQLYRELEAGRIEKKLCPIGHRIGDMPESHLP